MSGTTESASAGTNEAPAFPNEIIMKTTKSKPYTKVAGVTLVAGLVVVSVLTWPDRQEPDEAQNAPVTTQASAGKDDWKPGKAHHGALKADEKPGERALPLRDAALVALSMDEPVPVAATPEELMERARFGGNTVEQLSSPSVAVALDESLENQGASIDPSKLLDIERRAQASASRFVSREDRDSAFEFLRHRPKEISDSRYAEVANDLIGMLVADPGLTGETLQGLVEIANDTGREFLLRDYVVQHFHVVHRHAAYRELAVGSLLEWSEQADPVISGSAMRVLEHWSAPLMPEQEERLQSAALQTLAREGPSVGNRTAALSLCSQRGWKGVLEPARTLALDPRAPLALRLHAVYALGVVGDGTRDLSLLSSLRNRPDAMHLRTAIDAARRRLES
jgi:hypothetical protein